MGNPDVVIASDFYPHVSTGGPQLAQAVALTLERHGWKAGETTVGYYACWEDWYDAPFPDECAPNAEAYAASPRIVAVIGGDHGLCLHHQLPVLNEASEGASRWSPRRSCGRV